MLQRAVEHHLFAEVDGIGLKIQRSAHVTHRKLHGNALSVVSLVGSGGEHKIGGRRILCAEHSLFISLSGNGSHNVTLDPCSGAGVAESQNLIDSVRIFLGAAVGGHIGLFVRLEADTSIAVDQQQLPVCTVVTEYAHHAAGARRKQILGKRSV